MASAQKSGSVLQVWLPHPTDEQLRQYAADERRSLSSTIRLAVEDRLSEETSPGAAKAERPVGGLPHVHGAAPASGEDG